MIRNPTDLSKPIRLLVLADFLEETGKSSIAKFLRAGGDHPSNYYLELAGASSLTAIIKMMNPSTARLFACNVVLLNPSDILLRDFSSSIDSAINVEFGLTSLQQNEFEQRKAYKTYLRVKSELESLSSWERRNRGWKTIR